MNQHELDRIQRELAEANAHLQTHSIVKKLQRTFFNKLVDANFVDYDQHLSVLSEIDPEVESADDLVKACYLISCEARDRRDVERAKKYMHALVDHIIDFNIYESGRDDTDDLLD